MVITYHGAECFKVTSGDTTIVFNPISKKSKLSGPKFGSDVAFITLNHPDFNGGKEMEYGSKKPFIVDGPGEYEIGDVTAMGHGVRVTYENVERYNTIYQVKLEGINIVFLGALADEKISPEILGEFGDIDILFIPIGADDVLDVPQASKLATKLEAKCIIPMHYDDKALKAFLKEEGVNNGKTVEKFTVRKKDLSEMESEIVVLKA